MTMSLGDIAILNTKDADYCCIISRNRNSEAIKDKNIIIKDKNLLSHIKIGRKVLASHNIEIKKKIHCHKSSIF